MRTGSHHGLTLFLSTAAFVLIAGPGRAQVVRVPTFPVGTAAFSEHLQDVDVAPAPDGGFVVIWGDYSLHNLSGADDHADTRRFSADGVPLGSPVLADTSAHVFDPKLSPDGRGGYVAAWQWIRSGSQYRFFGQYLDPLGAPTGSDFEVGLNATSGPVIFGTVLGRAAGPTFVWDEHGFWARSVDTDKERRGGDIRVGSGGYHSDIAPLADGGFVTTWTGGWDEAASMGRIFGPNAEPRTDAFALGDDFAVAQVAASPLGGIAAVGSRLADDGTHLQVWVRRFTESGVPLEDGFAVHDAAPHDYVEPDAEFDALGNLYVVWTEYGDGVGQPVRARAYDVDANPLGPEIAITTRTGAQVRTARLRDGAFVNVWYWGGQAWGTIVTLCPAGTAVCGDGMRAPGCEQCDDGAANSDAVPDACRRDCRRARCGDGVVDAGEDCDDGNTASCDGCSVDCRLEPGFRCGDGIRNRACGEECDRGAANSDSTSDACRTDCREARCGDGTLDAGEECDDGNPESCDGCSFDCRLEVALADACDTCRQFAGGPVCIAPPYAFITEAERARFAHGRDEFLEVENPATGLGPVFNGTRCAECHNQPTIGGSSDRFVTRIGKLSPNASGYPVFDPLTDHGGPVIQSRGLATDACTVPGEVVPAEATFVSRRNTPALFGLGLLEAIPDVQMRIFGSSSRRKPDGIRGHYNSVGGLVGRFGWKAQVRSLHDFAAEAYRDEIGITNPLATTENGPQGGPLVCDAEPDPEDDGSDVAAFADFMTLLAPPPTSRFLSSDARKGKHLFRKLKCQFCHTDKYRTAANFPIAALRSQRVLAYTDLLLHDMGPELADGIVQGSASGRDFRTAPLWGVRYSAPYLHDGRAATLAQAIAAHGGEARAARDRFLALGAYEQGTLVAYLNAL